MQIPIFCPQILLRTREDYNDAKRQKKQKQNKTKQKNKAKTIQTIFEARLA